MRLLLPALASLAILSVDANLQAAPIEFRCPEPGTFFQTSRNWSWTFRSRDGWLCEYENHRRERGWRFAMLLDWNALVIVQDGATVAKLWPLEIGKKVQAAHSGVGDVRASNFIDLFHVLREESITVPAGTFSTIVIEYRIKVISEHTSHELVRTWWYEPNLGIPIKFTFDIVAGVVRGARPPENWEAVRVGRRE